MSYTYNKVEGGDPDHFNVELGEVDKEETVQNNQKKDEMQKTDNEIAKLKKKQIQFEVIIGDGFNDGT